jgi:hypothetical protein
MLFLVIIWTWYLLIAFALGVQSQRERDIYIKHNSVIHLYDYRRTEYGL